MVTIFSRRAPNVAIPAGIVRRLAASGVDSLLDWDRRLHERRHLATLDDRALDDLGLSRADIMREIDKRFWER